MIRTIRGDVDSREFNRALPHEHLFLDLRPLAAPLDDEDFLKPLTLRNFGKVSRNPYAVLDNAVITDENVQEEEISLLKKFGRCLFTDVTTDDFGRDAEKIFRLSEKTGVDVVMGCGRYIDCAVENKDMTEDAMYDEIMRDLTRKEKPAGVIGEIGSSDHITDFERRSLRAAARAQKETGFGMHIHACLWNDEGLRAIDTAVEAGANPAKLCVDHADVRLNREYIDGILKRGAYVEFDDFGKEYYVDRCDRVFMLDSFRTDRERVATIKELIQEGYRDQILLSNDICLKSGLHAYGGWGFDHVLGNIASMMQDFGISETDIDALLRVNPLRFLERI